MTIVFQLCVVTGACTRHLFVSNCDCPCHNSPYTQLWYEYSCGPRLSIIYNYVIVKNEVAMITNARKQLCGLVECNCDKCFLCPGFESSCCPGLSLHFYITSKNGQSKALNRKLELLLHSNGPFIRYAWNRPISRQQMDIVWERKSCSPDLSVWWQGALRGWISKQLIGLSHKL